MKIFIDTANLADIEAALKRGFAQGITTNPSLLAKEPPSSFEAHIGKIIDLINKYQPGVDLSVEVFSNEPAEMLKQAEGFIKKFAYAQMSIKVQVGWDELAVIKELAKRGISVNCTACMTVTQAIMAARAGARYVSLFWGRIRDGGIEAEPAMAAARDELLGRKVLDSNDFNPDFVTRSVRQILDQGKITSEIIVGSVRSMVDIRDAALAGAHIVTIPPKFFADMASHFKTDQIVEQFLRDFAAWIQ